MTELQRISELELQLIALREVVSTLIGWMASSANSPISVSEAEKLLDMMDQS
jgi:hypothetical protein